MNDRHYILWCVNQLLITICYSFCVHQVINQQHQCMTLALKTTFLTKDKTIINNDKQMLLMVFWEMVNLYNTLTILRDHGMLEVLPKIQIIFLYFLANTFCYWIHRLVLMGLGKHFGKYYDFWCIIRWVEGT